MLPYSGIRNRSLKHLFVYLFLITPGFLFALHIDMHSGGSIDLSLARAQTSDDSAEQETPPSEDPNEPLPQEPEPEPPAPESAEAPSPSEVEKR